jgi:hypothetical protein
MQKYTFLILYYYSKRTLKKNGGVKNIHRLVFKHECRRKKINKLTTNILILELIASKLIL